MPQTLAKVLVHLVFSTKNRRPLIAEPDRERTFAYLAGVLKTLECPVLRVGGMSDHVHLLFAQPRTLALSKIVEELKKESSKWAKDNVHPNFYWQTGYGAFSVSPIHSETVVEYIANQEQHHRTVTFQDEFRAFLQRYEIEWDEKYVWD